MSIVFLLLIIIIFSNASYVKDDSLHSNYLNKENTTTINGIFVLLVFMSHATQYMTLSGPYHSFYIFISGFLNQAIVVTFMFYSGYGLMEGIKRKGNDYTDTFPKKIIKLWLQFDAAILLFLLTNWSLGTFPTFKEILLALSSWGGIGNSNWYITAMLLLYFFMYLSFKVSKNNWVSLIILLTLTMLCVFFFMKIGRPKYTYNTMICFSFGVGYSLVHNKIEKLLSNSLIFISSILIPLILMIYTRPTIYQNIKFYSIWMICFMILILLFTMKINIKNSFLHFLGTQVFTVYILQRIPMMILAYLGYNNRHFTFFTVSFLVTLILAILFDKYILPQIDKLILFISNKQIKNKATI